jgi:uncharacterized protein (DUF2126 family)
VDQKADGRVTTDPAHSVMHSLARDLCLHLEQVARVYREEASKIEAEARIKTLCRSSWRAASAQNCGISEVTPNSIHCSIDWRGASAHDLPN